MRVEIALIDQEVYKWMQDRANCNEVHVVVCDLPDELKCGRNTVYRSIKRLQNAGYIMRLDGSRRTGYTYRIT